MRCGLERGVHMPSCGMARGLVVVPGAPGFPPGASWVGDGTDPLFTGPAQPDSQPDPCSGAALLGASAEKQKGVTRTSRSPRPTERSFSPSVSRARAAACMQREQLKQMLSLGTSDAAATPAPLPGSPHLQMRESASLHGRPSAFPRPAPRASRNGTAKPERQETQHQSQEADWLNDGARCASYAQTKTCASGWHDVYAARRAAKSTAGADSRGASRPPGPIA